jgi:DNA-directed RNA polymerase specialized sigma24 family protein
MHPRSAPPVVARLPLHATVVRRLRERQVPLQPGSDEDAEIFESRIETELMTLFRDEGDDAAFQALYDYTRGRLLIWIAGLLGSRRASPDPLEILQDSYVNIYRYARSFRNDDPRSFRVWSRTIAGNLVRRARQPRAVRSFDNLPEGRLEPVDLRVSPAEAMVHEEEAGRTARAWLIVLLQYAAAYERLSPRDRLALDMIEVQGLSYAEAGARLRVGLSNMKMIMFRSRRRIRALIAQRFDDSIAERVSA